MITISTSQERLIDGFSFIPQGKIYLGTEYPLPCAISGKRHNETPVHVLSVKSFWMSKTVVSNEEFEKFDPRHKRCHTSLGDNDPITEVTYAEAVEYSKWLSVEKGINFSLPTELEWCLAAGPFGWAYPYKRGPKPVSGFANTHSQNIGHALAVDDSRYGTNCFGLYHMAGNIQEMTLDVYRTKGHYGFYTNGSYCIIKGGDFGHCDFSTRICTRGIFDVAARCTRTGFRLVAHHL